MKHRAMSNVYKRNQNPTRFDPVDFAKELQIVVTTYAMNEKYIPKKWRMVLGIDLIRKADEILDNIYYANEIRARDDRTKALRSEYWCKAAANCKQLDRKLSRLQGCVPTATAHTQKPVLESLNKVQGAIAERRHRE